MQIKSRSRAFLRFLISGGIEKHSLLQRHYQAGGAALSLVSGVLLSLAPHAGADTLYFDTNGTADGSAHLTNQQTWNSTTLDWTTDPNGDITTGLWVNNDDAVFSAGTNATLAYVVSSGGNLTTNSITIQEGTLSFNASATPPSRTVGAGGITLDSTANGTVSFNNNANGTSFMTLIVAATQAWTDDHTTASFIANGPIKANATVGNTYILTTAVNGSGSMVFSNVVSDGTAGGNLALVVDSTGAGPLNLENANTYTGGTTLTAGTLLASNTTGSATGTGIVTLNGGILSSAAGDGTATTGSVSDVVAGTGPHTISPGGIGTLGRLATGNLTINSNTTLQFDITDTTHLDQILLPSNTLSFSGTGTAAVTVPTGLASGTYTLIDYGSTALTDTSNFALTGAPAGYSLTLDGANTALDLVVGAGGGPVSAQWNSTTGGSWGLAGNWTPSIPDGPGTTATFGSTLAGSDTITLDGNRTVGHIVFNNSSASYNIGVAAGDTTSTLTINNNAAGATGSPDITVTAGSHTISAPLVIPAATTVTRLGAGTLTLSGPITAGVGSTLAVTAGTTNISTDPTANLSLHASNAGTQVNFTAATSGGIQVRNAGLIIDTSAKVSLLSPANHANRTVLVTPTLTIAAGSTLDLGSNDLIVKGAGETGYGTINTQVATGRGANGVWTGAGITSSAAAASPSNTALAVVVNDTNQTPAATLSGTKIFGTFDGQTVNDGDVLVKYTYYGDALLTGSITAADYIQIDSGFTSNGALTGWFNGDFNYDGKINGDDYTLIDNAFNSQGSVTFASGSAGPTSQIAPSAVPEPTTLTLFSIAAITTLQRRKRQRQTNLRSGRPVPDPSTGRPPEFVETPKENQL
jgi:fibronectin-binding autotransporter adhesin